jgi:RNA polymerase sigma-70 factor, ECF subfamily
MVSPSETKCLVKATEHKKTNFTGGTDVTPIVDVLYGSLYQFAVRLTRSESDAADLVQQTFLTLIQRLHQIRDYSKIKYWLFTTLRRNFLIEVRRRRKYSEVEFLPDVHDFEAVDPEAWRSLDAQRLREALLQVDPMYGTALELFYRSNLSYREIGKALEIPMGTVMSRLSRGKAQLRSILSTNSYAVGFRCEMVRTKIDA